jgi:ribonucleotide reductase alpha subunit
MVDKVIDKEHLLELLCLADELFCDRHGCFPLDRVTAQTRYWNDAMQAIRAITGEDYEKRQDMADKALTKYRLPFVDINGISKTINLPNNATVDDIEKVYYDAWKAGLKDGLKVLTKYRLQAVDTKLNHKG